MLKLSRLVLVGVSVLALAACTPQGDPFGSGFFQPDNSNVSAPAAPAEQPPAPVATNQAPAIANVPPTSAVAGSFYDFTVVASDPDSPTLWFTAGGLPAWLSLDRNTGRLSGTPFNEDAGDTADITLAVTDGQSVTALPAFHITVGALLPPTPPPAADNQPPVVSGTPATSVMATRDYDFAPSVQDVDSAVLTWSIDNKPAWASFSSTTGRLSGTPGRAQAGTTSNIVISAFDGALSSSLPPFSIEVTPAPNAAPVIGGMPATSVQAGATYSFTATASDPDGEALSFSIANLPVWASFDKATGQLSGTPSASQVGTYSNIRIWVDDGIDSATLPTFAIVVTAAANRNPVISGSPSTAVQVGTPYSFTPSASDPDGSAVSFSIANLPSWANFNSTTGLLSGTPNASQVGAYPDIRISVNDGSDSATLQAFTITVTAAPVTNQPPNISGSPATTVQAGTAYSFTPNGSDPDGNPLFYSIANRPSWANFNNTTGQLWGTPNASEVGSYSNIVISVSDGTATTAMPAFSISVSPAPVVNRPPSISGSPATSVQAGSGYSFVPSASDPDGNPLFFSISGRPSWANFNNTTGQLSGTPGATQVGTYSSIVISVSDGTASATLPAFGITVTSAPVVNNPPTISGSPATSVEAGQAYAFTPSASDPEGNTLTFSISGRPAWATFNAANGSLTGTPNSSQVGSYPGVVITVSDGTNSRSLPAFSINVTSAGTGNGTATLSWNAPTTNTDGSALTDLAGYRLYHGTSAANLDDVRTVANPGVTSFVFDQLPAGTHYFAITAYNAAGAESPRSAAASKTIP